MHLFSPPMLLQGTQILQSGSSRLVGSRGQVWVAGAGIFSCRLQFFSFGVCRLFLGIRVGGCRRLALLHMEVRVRLVEDPDVDHVCKAASIAGHGGDERPLVDGVALLICFWHVLRRHMHIDLQVPGPEHR